MVLGNGAMWSMLNAARAQQTATLAKLREADAKYDTLERITIISEYLNAVDALARRSPVPAEQPTPVEQAEFLKSYKADIERIAARHRMTAAELEDFANARHFEYRERRATDVL